MHRFAIGEHRAPSTFIDVSPNARRSASVQVTVQQSRRLRHESDVLDSMHHSPLRTPTTPDSIAGCRNTMAVVAIGGMFRLNRGTGDRVAAGVHLISFLQVGVRNFAMNSNFGSLLHVPSTRCDDRGPSAAAFGHDYPRQFATEQTLGVHWVLLSWPRPAPHRIDICGACRF